MDIAANGNVTIMKSLNINGLVSEGKALFVNGTEALWYNGTYFSWGFGASYNYFANNLVIATVADPGGNRLVVNGPAAKPGGGSWATWSDARLKEIHKNYPKGLQEITDLRPVIFTYREDNPLMLPDDQEYVGLVAQDVQEVFPEAVIEGKDGYLQLDLQAVNIALINAVKDLKRQNDELRQRIEALEREIFNLNIFQ